MEGEREEAKGWEMFGGERRQMEGTRPERDLETSSFIDLVQDQMCIIMTKCLLKDCREWRSAEQPPWPETMLCNGHRQLWPRSIAAGEKVASRGKAQGWASLPKAVVMGWGKRPWYLGVNYMGRERNTPNFSNSCNCLDLLITLLSLSERQGNKLGLDATYSHSCCVSSLICNHSLWHIVLVLSKNWQDF